MTVCYTFRISGFVQGVGYRYFAVQQAFRLGLRGYAKNLPGGAVEVVAEGDEEALERFTSSLKVGSRGAEVKDIQVSASPAKGAFSGFSIVHGSVE